MEELREDNEQWKTIRDFPNYEVSSLGRIKSKQRETITSVGTRYILEEKIMQVQYNIRTGYAQILLRDGKKFKLLYVHRLVAEAFIPNSTPWTGVVHKDGDKRNNKASNLMYGKRGSKKKKWLYIIKQKLLNGCVIATYIGFDELYSKGYKRNSIIAAANNRYTKGSPSVYKGYKWEAIRLKQNRPYGK